MVLTGRGSGRGMKGILALLLLVFLAVLLAGCQSTGGQTSPMETPLIETPQVPAALPPPPPSEAPPALPTPLLFRGDQSSPLRLNFSFNSSGKEEQVSLGLDPAVLPSRGGGENCILASWRPGDDAVLASYYAGIFRDPGEDALYTPLLSELHRIRRSENLNDDEYLELMVHFVQAIPYDPDAPVCPRTPAGVILDGKGDCDEKSLLLLGLFYREGYDGALLLFVAENHATAGIRIDTATQPSFRVYETGGKKYVYIETTRPTFIGLYPDEFAAADPVVIPAGNGTIPYRAINNVMEIVSTQKRMEAKMTWLRDTGKEMIGEMEALESRLNSSANYDTQEEYDADYSRYSTLAAQYDEYMAEFLQINDVYQYILDHQDDRVGVSERIANSKVENLL